MDWLNIWRLGGSLIVKYGLYGAINQLIASSTDRKYLQWRAKQISQDTSIRKIVEPKSTQSTQPQTKQYQSPQRQSKIRKFGNRVKPAQMSQSRLRIMPSSWIRDVDYDTLTGELHINMRGKWYGPWYVDNRTYHKFIVGDAVPTTTDRLRPARWAEGFGPSLGAAYHQFIKIGGATPIMTETLAQRVQKKYEQLAMIQ